MHKVGDIFQYVGSRGKTDTEQDTAVYMITDVSNAPIYLMMCIFDNSYMYEDEDRLTNKRLYRMLA